MFAPSVHLIVRQCQSQWRSRVFRNILIQHQRQLTSKSQEKKDDGNVVVQSTTSSNQIEVATFKEKGLPKIKTSKINDLLL